MKLDRHGVLAVSVGVALASVAAARTHASEVGPWDRSLVLERDGDLAGAEAVVVEAWGKQPDNYFAQLRLAYLALMSGKDRAAIARYARARRFPEADGDEDADTGYAAALALRGWHLAEDGRLTLARTYWQRALAVRPDQPDAKAGLALETKPITQPEVWSALVGQRFGAYHYRGTALFAQLPWRFFDRLTVRLAGRYVAWQQTGRPIQSAPSASWSVREIYGGGGYQTRWLSVEALGFASSSTGTPLLSGGGLGLRVGRRWGGAMDVAALHSRGRWANEQLRLVAWLAVGAGLGCLAGTRLTHEPGQFLKSGLVGAWFEGNPVDVYLSGHLGTEHWAADLASPSVLSLSARTHAGGTLSALWSLGQTFRVAGQASLATLDAGGVAGLYWSASLGVQLRIRNL
jgi:hypothetical protein